MVPHQPLTRTEAEATCATHQHLKGQAINPSAGAPGINSIVVAPFSEQNQTAFIRHILFLGGDAEEALDGYTDEEFDVLLLSFSGKDIANVTAVPLRDYLAG